ncbi:MAG: hypothetical protein VX335_04155 [Pseudomonadota bacterium]|nr:hypothetical protein [Pseudomonadota bacterium]
MSFKIQILKILTAGLLSMSILLSSDTIVGFMTIINPTLGIYSPLMFVTLVYTAFTIINSNNSKNNTNKNKLLHSTYICMLTQTIFSVVFSFYLPLILPVLGAAVSTICFAVVMLAMNIFTRIYNKYNVRTTSPITNKSQSSAQTPSNKKVTKNAAKDNKIRVKSIAKIEPTSESTKNSVDETTVDDFSVVHNSNILNETVNLHGTYFFEVPYDMRNIWDDRNLVNDQQITEIEDLSLSESSISSVDSVSMYSPNEDIRSQFRPFVGKGINDRERPAPATKLNVKALGIFSIFTIFALLAQKAIMPLSFMTDTFLAKNRKSGKNLVKDIFHNQSSLDTIIHDQKYFEICNKDFYQKSTMALTDYEINEAASSQTQVKLPPYYIPDTIEDISKERSKNNILEKDIEKCKASLNNTLTKHEAERSYVNGLLKKSEANNDQVVARLSYAVSQNKELKLMMASLEKEHNYFKDHNEKKLASANELITKLQAFLLFNQGKLGHKIADSQKVIDKTLEEITLLHQEKEILEKKGNKAETKIITLEKEVDQLTDKINSKIAAMSEKEIIINQKSTDIHKLEKDIADKEKRYSEELDNYKSQILELSNELALTKENKELLEKIQTNISDQLVESKVQKEGLEASLKSLNETSTQQIHLLAKREAEAIRKLDETTAKKEGLEASINALNETSTRQIHLLAQREAEAIRKLNDTTAEKDNLKASIISLNETSTRQIHLLEQREADVKIKLEKAKTEIYKLIVGVSSLKEKTLKEISSKDSEISSIKAKFNEARDLLSTLSRKEAELRLEKVQLEKKQMEYKTEIIFLEKNVGKKNYEIDVFKNEISELSDELARIKENKELLENIKAVISVKLVESNAQTEELKVLIKNLNETSVQERRLFEEKEKESAKQLEIAIAGREELELNLIKSERDFTQEKIKNKAELRKEKQKLAKCKTSLLSVGLNRKADTAKDKFTNSTIGDTYSKLRGVKLIGSSEKYQDITPQETKTLNISDNISRDKNLHKLARYYSTVSNSSDIVHTAKIIEITKNFPITVYSKSTTLADLKLKFGYMPTMSSDIINTLDISSDMRKEKTTKISSLPYIRFGQFWSTTPDYLRYCLTTSCRKDRILTNFTNETDDSKNMCYVSDIPKKNSLTGGFWHTITEIYEKSANEMKNVLDPKTPWL